MATATLPNASRTPRSKRRTSAYVLLALLTFAGLVVAYNFASIKGQAKLGVSYGAHVACSCRYIEGRDLKSCITDFEPGMEMISISDDPTHKRITASVPFLAKAMAERRGTYGCQQLNDAEIDSVN
jgi:hypothetical protein